MYTTRRSYAVLQLEPTLNARTFLTFLSILALTACAGAAQAGPLEEGFRTPPRDCSMVPFWAWNGHLDAGTLRWQIDQFVDKGVYGAFMHARAGIDKNGTPYFSDAWWDAIRVSVEHGKEVGFSPWIYDEDKWPSGAAGGRTMARNPERNVQKALHRIEMRVEGPEPVAVSIPGARFVVAGKLTDESHLEAGSLTDISGFNQAATAWPCPEGRWLIAGYVFGPYHEGINYLNKDTVQDFIDITHEAYAARFGEYFGTVIPGVFFDEIMNDAGKNPEYVVWAEGFEERFKAMKGYDIGPLLPALTYDIGPRTPVIRCDYYDVFTTLYEEAWFIQMADWCAKHGLMETGHTIEELNRYITQGDYMRTERHLQIPLTDNEDFRYTWPRTIGIWKPKQIASVSQLYGRSMTGVEALGGAGWSFTLDAARYGFNMLAAYGVNFFVPHGFFYQYDQPEQVGDWPNSWFFRNPYWKYFKTFADDGSRLSFMLRGGQPVTDVAVLYPQANQWSGNGPGTTQDSIEQLVSHQTDANLIDTDSLLKATIRGAKLVAGDLEFRTFIVPGVQCIRASEAQKIATFAEAGGTVIVHDRFPADSMEQGKDDPALAEFRRKLEAKGIVPVSLNDSLRKLTEEPDRDFAVVDADESPLRYRHVRRDNHDIYWVANGSRRGGAWRVRFRSTGNPEWWRPEDGSITPIGAFVRTGNHTECTVRLDGWQGVFVVFDNAAPAPEGGVELTTSNLEDARVTCSADREVQVTGFLASGAKARVRARLVSPEGPKEMSAEADVAPVPRPIALDGGWEFLPVDHQLDYEWRIDVPRTDLEIPVMRVRWEPAADDAKAWQEPSLDDRRWRPVKVLDTLHANEGAERYRSRWRAGCITYLPYTPFNLDRFFVPVLGGKGLTCRKTVLLPPEVTHGWIAVLCDSPFRVMVNGEEVASGPGGESVASFPLKNLRPGASTLAIAADDAKTILAEGAFVPEFGEPILFFTDDTWEASVAGSEWIKAWVYLQPPEEPIGEPAYPGEPELPRVVWYRQDLPPGTDRVYKPEIEGAWDAWIDGSAVSFSEGEARVPSGGQTHCLALRVKLGASEHGLMQPVKVRCAPVRLPLGSWADRQLDWYSGRSLYSTAFDLDDAYLQKDTRLVLDLGKVCYNAEVWLNGDLVATRIWPPYRVDISKYAKPGQNRLTVVVANLIANRMRWNIFDDAKTNLILRRWHDSVLRRDGWCFDSGLIGPVRVEPRREVTLSLAAGRAQNGG